MSTVQFWSAIFFGFVTLLAVGWLWDAWTDYSFAHLSAAEHLARAKQACGPFQTCSDPREALHQLSVIPASAPENEQARYMIGTIELNRQVQERAAQENANAAQVRAQEKKERNFRGEAHDMFECATSKDGRPIVSFDAGTTWWIDDGRCLDDVNRRAEEKQRRQNEDAKLHSYWSTAIRVDTDMDSTWLPDEERTCTTYPDEKGRVATVRCITTATHATHNIPVRFWGGVDRNIPSDWKCRREKDLLNDAFVCRAIN